MSNDRDTQQHDDAPNELVADVAATGGALIPAVVEQVLGSLGGRAFHNFTGSKQDVWRRTAIATGPDVMPASEALNRTIQLHNFYVHQVQISGPTEGEYIDAVRCVLIDDDDNAYGFVSDGVARDLGRLIAHFGMGPYEPPIDVKVVQGNTRRGRRYYSIQPA